MHWGKNTLFSFLLAAVGSVVTATPDLKRLEFVIIVPSYNNEGPWIKRNLESLVSQRTSTPFSIICINDCSTDKTGKMMDDFAQAYNLDPSFLKIIHNKKRRGALANIYNTIHKYCKNNQVVVLVDGDDTLAHPLVLERLAQEYEDPNVWLTYGSFMFYPGAKWGTTFEIPLEALLKREVRSLKHYVAQHLRTFRVPLFKKIKKEDLMLDGKFFSVNADMATMIPMIEMCAPKDAQSPNHSKIINDILYIYNYNNPLQDERIHRKEQLDIEEVIKRRKPYEPLDSLY